MPQALPASVAFILLAAGNGSRFGGAKQMATLAGRPLWQHAAAAAEAAGFATRIVVAPPGLTMDAAGWQTVVNARSASGIASSIAAGLRAAAEAERAVFALADMPYVGHEHLRTLALAEGVVFTAQPDGRRGIPAAFRRAAFARLLTLSGDRGAAALEWPESTTIAADSASLRDIDTLHDLAEAAQAHMRKPANG